MGHLSTHVLDTMNGCPAAGMAVRLLRLNGDSVETLQDFTLNKDGRNDGGALLDASSMAAGRYRLVFSVAPYFRARGVELPEPGFHRHGAARLRHRRRRRPLPRSAARQSVVVLDLPRLLKVWIRVYPHTDWCIFCIHFLHVAAEPAKRDCSQFGFLAVATVRPHKARRGEVTAPEDACPNGRVQGVLPTF